MNTTTIEDYEKVLKNILPENSNDFWWSDNFIYYQPTAQVGISENKDNLYSTKWSEEDIPAWSVGKLLDLLTDKFYIFLTYNEKIWVLMIRSKSNLDNQIMLRDPDKKVLCVKMYEELRNKGLI